MSRKEVNDRYGTVDKLEDAVSGRPVDVNQPEPDYCAREVANRPV